MNHVLLQKLINKVMALPYHKFINFEILSYGKGTCKIEVTVSPHLLNAFDAVHGGTHYIVCDVAAFIAICTVCPDGYLAVTSDINISILSAGYSGKLTYKASILKTGKRIGFIETKVFDDDKKLIAVARITKSLVSYPKMEEVLNIQ